MTIIPTVTPVTSNQAPTETIITTQKEFDIMEMMQGQLGEKK